LASFMKSRTSWHGATCQERNATADRISAGPTAAERAFGSSFPRSSDVVSSQKRYTGYSHGVPAGAENFHISLCPKMGMGVGIKLSASELSSREEQLYGSSVSTIFTTTWGLRLERRARHASMLPPVHEKGLITTPFRCTGEHLEGSDGSSRPRLRHRQGPREPHPMR
jgi:hypothetical protein